MNEREAVEKTYDMYTAQVNKLYSLMNAASEHHRRLLTKEIIEERILGQYDWELNYQITSYDNIYASLECKDESFKDNELIVAHAKINPYTRLLFNEESGVKTAFDLHENDGVYYITTEERGIDAMKRVIEEHNLDVDTTKLEMYRQKLMDLLDLVSHD